MEELYKNKEWLYEEYVVKKRSAENIGREFNKPNGNTVRWYLNKYNIPIRGMSEAVFLARKNEDINISDYTKSIIIGNLLGDGCLCVKVKNSKLARTAKYAQCCKYPEFVEHVSYLLSLSGIRQIGSIYKNINKNNSGITYHYSTCSYKELLPLRNYMYVDDKKIIPRDFEFESEAVLYWFLGDGSLNKPKKARPYVTIAMQGYDNSDIDFAAYWFTQKSMEAKRDCNKNLRFMNRKSINFLEYIGGKSPVSCYDYKFDM